MATKNVISKKQVYLIVWEISHTALRAGILTSSGYNPISDAPFPLDEKLLVVLERHKKVLSGLSGIGIVPSALGGFASSRLLLATLNPYAWLRQIPIVALPASEEQKAQPELFMLMQRKCGSAKKGAQVLPEYQRPANTTVSKKKKYTLA